MNRVTVVGTVYHQAQGEQPTSIDLGFSTILASDDQPYERRVTVTEEWTPLDCGWLGDKASLLLIRNLAGRFLEVNPTPDEREAEEAKIIEVSYGPKPSPQSCWLIHPKRVFQGAPGDPTQLFIRCRQGKTKALIYLLPS